MYTDISVHRVSKIELEVRDRESDNGKPFRVYALTATDTKGEEVEFRFFVTDDIEVDAEAWHEDQQ